MKTIAIIGGGPAGCTAGYFLAKSGYQVGIFQNEKRQELIVGESLLPSIIPILRELGMEEKIKSFSTFKPGASFCWNGKEVVGFDFNLAKTKLNYAYNCPRDKFDKCLQNAAKEAGCHFFYQTAKLEIDKNNLPQLSKEIQESCGDFFKKGADFIIDASGRARVLSKLMKLPAISGARKDKALFAHLKIVEIQSKGHIHVDRFSKGWGWRIPLPDCVSVGIVISQNHLSEFGKSSEQQFDNLMKEEPLLKKYAPNFERISKVMTYTNYQWKSEKLIGKNWMLIGDSSGFIDPVFSTGLHLAMDSAKKGALALINGKMNALNSYEIFQKGQLKTWQEIIDYWYNGKLFTLFQAGESLKQTLLGRIINPHITKHVTKIFTGEANHESYSSKLLNFMTKYGLLGVDPDELSIV